MIDKEFEMLSEQLCCSDNKQLNESVVYDGSKESVEKIMNLVGFTRGINNTPSYLMMFEKIIPRDSVFTERSIILPSGKKEFFDKRDFLCLV